MLVSFFLIREVKFFLMIKEQICTLARSFNQHYVN